MEIQITIKVPEAGGNSQVSVSGGDAAAEPALPESVQVSASNEPGPPPMPDNDPGAEVDDGAMPPSLAELGLQGPTGQDPDPGPPPVANLRAADDPAMGLADLPPDLMDAPPEVAEDLEPPSIEDIAQAVATATPKTKSKAKSRKTKR